MTKISTRQILFFLAFIAPVGKIIFMPSHLAYYAENDLLFPALINYLVQTGVVFLVLLLSKSNQTFYKLLENTFGRIAAKILIVVFGLFLLYASFLPIQEQKLLVQSVMYDTLPQLFTFLPFFLFLAFLCLKPLSSSGRIWDILALFSAVGFLGLFVLSAGKAEYESLLPVGAAGAGGIFKGTIYTMSWFYDSALLLLFMGRFEYKKGLAWKGALSYFGGGLIVLFFLAVFYGIYSEIAPTQLFAFTKISKYFSGITVLGRIDYFFIYLLILVMAFYVALPVQAGVECLKDAIGNGKTHCAIYAVTVSVTLFALTALLKFFTYRISDVVSNQAFWVFPVFCIAIPILSLLLRRNREKE